MHHFSRAYFAHTQLHPTSYVRDQVSDFLKREMAKVGVTELDADGMAIVDSSAAAVSK